MQDPRLDIPPLIRVRFDRMEERSCDFAVRLDTVEKKLSALQAEFSPVKTRQNERRKEIDTITDELRWFRQLLISGVLLGLGGTVLNFVLDHFESPSTSPAEMRDVLDEVLDARDRRAFNRQNNP